jgi:feruloyl esterase
VPSLRDAQHNVVTALESWVEKGTAPSAIIATKFVSDDPAKGVKLSRPICAYPQSVEYKGSGDPNNAANFSCAAAQTSH